MRSAVLEHLFMSMLTQDSLAPRRSAANPALIAAGILALAGAGFLIVAGYDWLSANYDVQTARIAAGTLSLALSVLVLIGFSVFQNYKRKKVRAYFNVVKDNIHSALTSVSDELEEPIRENPKTAVLMAGMAGYIAAEKLLH